MSAIINVEIKRKRLTSKQKNRANHNFNDTNQGLEDYFRISVFIPYIDYFVSQLELRFLAHKQVFVGKLKILIFFIRYLVTFMHFLII